MRLKSFASLRMTEQERRYFSIVENRRIAPDKTVQRTVFYLGEINDQQQAAWRKTFVQLTQIGAVFRSLKS